MKPPQRAALVHLLLVHTPRKWWVPCLFLIVAGHHAMAQGIRGRVLDQEGAPLSYASLYIEETGSGTTANTNGRYELRLEPGTYHVQFRHLGHQTVNETLKVGEGWTQRDIVLPELVYTLGTAEIRPGDEDPAYPIMRKAIAKSGYFRRQIEAYTCRVYLKGSGRLTDYPWYSKRLIEKEGIDTSAAFTTESITDVSYSRPNRYTQKTIYIRTTGDDQDLEPLNYINASFYQDRIAGFVSPLSKRAFAYYKFRYLNTYGEGDYQIDKIRVVPRLSGERLFAGDLYIVDGLWNIHSVNFTTEVEGITLNVRQNFAPIEPDIWLPVSHQYFGAGEYLGFAFEFNYVASVADYAVTRNEALESDFTLLDEKTQAADLPEDTEADGAHKAVELSDTLSTKQLRKAMAEYAKAERRKKDKPNLVGIRNVEMDSTAINADTAMWRRLRPVPLTPAEEKGFHLQDSLKAVRQDRNSAADQSEFSAKDMVLGNSYDLGRDRTLTIHNVLTSLRFNTVDGFNGRYGLTYDKRFSKTGGFRLHPEFRYAESRNKGSGFVRAVFDRGHALRHTTFTAEGGAFFSQFNDDEPISTFTNTIASLFVENNFMKIYDRDYASLNITRQWGAKFNAEIMASYNHRVQTYNSTNQVWFNIDNRQYTSNEPQNREIWDTGFGQSDAMVIGGKLTFSPFGRYYIRNDEPRLIPSHTHFTLHYRKAIPGVGHAEVDYDFLSLEGEHEFRLGVWGGVRARSEVGKFLSTENMDFMDYAHFMGNQTIFTRFSYMGGYSLMPYYAYSTNDFYWSTYLNIHPERFLLTQIPALRGIGASEYLNVNHLWTPAVSNYFEVGYSISNIFRLFRIDATAAFVDGRYRDFRVQLGITSELFSFDF